jgi:hypothetical protein
MTEGIQLMNSHTTPSQQLTPLVATHLRAASTASSHFCASSPPTLALTPSSPRERFTLHKAGGQGAACMQYSGACQHFAKLYAWLSRAHQGYASSQQATCRLCMPSCQTCLPPNAAGACAPRVPRIAFAAALCLSNLLLHSTQTVLLCKAGSQPTCTGSFPGLSAPRCSSSPPRPPPCAAQPPQRGAPARRRCRPGSRGKGRRSTGSTVGLGWDD